MSCDKTSWTKCHATKCHRQNVMDKMSWTKCHATKCHRQNVMDKMSWTKCHGQNVMDRMPWTQWHNGMKLQSEGLATRYRDEPDFAMNTKRLHPIYSNNNRHPPTMILMS